MSKPRTAFRITSQSYAPIAGLQSHLGSSSVLKVLGSHTPLEERKIANLINSHVSRLLSRTLCQLSKLGRLYVPIAVLWLKTKIRICLPGLQVIKHASYEQMIARESLNSHFHRAR